MNKLISLSSATILLAGLSGCATEPKSTGQAFYDGIESNIEQRKREGMYSTPPQYVDDNVNKDDVESGIINAVAHGVGSLFLKD
ncbi:hypothetical protein [Shewanella sp. UCD-KL12]|uniref:hypothetical protein n=1 Tax=Shewanella sp. UCD-KL12 TaxID=1917163 RepID=UPI00117E19B3|nr:hypothetical protein [Shewanella sp. UCD-KL12]